MFDQIFKMSSLSEKCIFFSLLFVSLLGPWTRPLAIIFGLSEFEETTVSKMVLFMLKKTPISLAYGSPYFIGVPFFLVLLRAFFERWASALQRALLVSSMVASIVSVIFLWIPLQTDRAATNIMGDIFVGDMVTMWAVHAALCALGDLPLWSIVFGPLFGLCIYIAQKKKPSSFLAGLVCIYVNIGTLYRGYLELESIGKEVFTQTLGIGEWYGYEIFAGVQVVLGFLILCASIPTNQFKLKTLRGTLSVLETVLYVILLNANVAFGWIASAGFLRGPLVRARF